MKGKISKVIKQADLNLLVTFHALLKFKSVKLASEELHLSQSAVSRALGRLRHTFNDELFTRTHSGLVPTDKAKDLEAQLSNILGEIDDLLCDERFTLSSCKESFILSVPTLIGCHLVPAIMKTLIKEAPQTSLFEVPPDSDPITKLKNGEVDFAIHNVPTFNKNYHCESLGNCNIVLYVRKEHPLLSKKKIKLQDLSMYPVIGNLVNNSNDSGYESPITQFCELIEIGKRPSLRSVQLNTLILTTECTDSIYLTSESLGKHLLSSSTLRKVELDESLELKMSIYLITLKNKLMNPSYSWFAELVRKEYIRIFL